MISKRFWWTAAGIAVLPLAWFAASQAVANELLLPGPGAVVAALGRISGTELFWRASAATSLRVLAGFALSWLLGAVCGVAAAKRPNLAALFRPGIVFLQTLPVLAVILLALVWLPVEAIAVFVCLIMAFPAVVLHLSAARPDESLSEMARSFGIGRLRRLLLVDLPALLPALVGSAAACLSLCWKVVLAAEVLSFPRYGLGSGLYDAKTRLDTAEMFAWTLAAVILGLASDAVLGSLARRLKRGWQT